MINFNVKLIESDLFINATDEAINHFGVPLVYIRAVNKNRDEILGEYQRQHYLAENVYELYGMFETFSSFEGELDLYSKFGIQVQENMHINISSKTFLDLGFQPMQNDLIYWNDGNSVFEVTFVSRDVDNTAAFFMGGKPHAMVWKLTAKKYVFDNDIVKTGISAIDDSIIASYIDSDKESAQEIDNAINNILDSEEKSPWEV